MAGEAGRDDVGASELGGDSLPLDLAEVSEIRDSGEALPEDGAGVPVDFGDGDGSVADALESEVETSCSRAERDDGRRTQPTKVASRWTLAAWMKRAAFSFSGVDLRLAIISSSRSE